MVEIAPKKYIFHTIDELLDNVKQGWLYVEFKDELFSEKEIANMTMEEILRSIASFIINEGIVIDEEHLAEKTPSIIELSNITDEELYEWFINPNSKKNEENNDKYLTLKNSPLYGKFVKEIDAQAPKDDKEYMVWLKNKDPYSDENFIKWLKENYTEDELKVLKKEIENNTNKEGIRRKL